MNSQPPTADLLPLATEAIDQTALEPHIVLPRATKMGVEVFHLDRPERQVAGDLEVRAAAKRHREGVGRGRGETGCAGRQPFPTEQHLRIRRQAPAVVVGEPGPEEVVDFMGRRSRGQAGDFAAADIRDHAEPAINVNAERAARALATRAGSALAWIDSDVHVLAGNLHAPSFLGLRVAGREQNEAEQNKQFTHHSLQARLSPIGWYYYYDRGRSPASQENYSVGLRE